MRFIHPKPARANPAPPALPPRRAAQRGGATIILAFALLVVMSLVAFSVSRNALRELTLTGTVTQGTKAEQAADAGLDWYIIWSHPDNATAATSTTGNKLLVAGLKDVKATTWGTSGNATYQANLSDGYFGSRTWDRGFRLVTNETDMATSDMVFDNTGALVKQNTATGSVVSQKFNVLVRFLGFAPIAMTGGGGQASGGTNPNSLATQDLQWQIVSDGQASVNLGGSYQRFTNRREMIGLQALSQ